MTPRYKIGHTYEARDAFGQEEYLVKVIATGIYQNGYCLIVEKDGRYARADVCTMVGKNPSDLELYLQCRYFANSLEELKKNHEVIQRLRIWGPNGETL